MSTHTIACYTVHMREAISQGQRICRVVPAGMLPYAVAWDWQRRLARQRSAGAIHDTLLLLQHPHTYTLGRATAAGLLLVGPDVLQEQGVTLIESDRGGDITYHGPG